MTIAINWKTSVIYVPKADLVLVQSSPIEIRELNINNFRLALRDLEDDTEGIGFLKTHNHNTIVNISGIQLARVVEILPPYTITFEDGAYAVNLVGANSNIADRLNLNQVSVRSANSAGLVNTSAIEFSSFSGVVCIDVFSTNVGTVFPNGTRQAPVNNLSDALIIAEYRGLKTLLFLSNFTFSATDIIINYTLQGLGKQITTLTFEDGCTITYCSVFKAKVSGWMTGIIELNDCYIFNFGSKSLIPSSNDIIVQNCLISGVISLPESYGGTLKVLDSWSEASSSTLMQLDMGFCSANLLILNFSGEIELFNNTHENDISVNFKSGKLVIDETVTAGNINVRGIGLIVNNSSSLTSLEISGLLNREEITKTSWNAVYINTDIGESGTEFPIGTAGNPSSNFADALLISEKYNIKEFRFIGEITPPLGSSLEHVKITGNSSVENCIFNLNGLEYNSILFDNCTLTGEMIGINVEFAYCYLSNITNISGYAIQSSFDGLIKIEPGKVLSCVWTIIEGDFTFFDLQNSNAMVSMDMESGWAQFINAGEGSLIELNVKGGEVSLEASCTGGEYYLEGIGTLYNESTMVAKANHFMWDESLTYHQDEGTIGKSLIILEYAGKVTIDPVNGADSIEYPYGTDDNPVKTIANAITIANLYRITTLFIIGSITITSDLDVSGFTIKAARSLGNSIIVEPGAITTGTYFENLTVTGTMNGYIRYTTCVLGTIYNFDGGAKNCLLTNDIYVSGNGLNYLTDCDTFITELTSYKTIHVYDKLFNIIRAFGKYKISDKTGVKKRGETVI